MSNKKIKTRALIFLGLVVLAIVIIILALSIRNHNLPGADLSSATVEIVPIATGNVHSMAITQDGSLWIWGSGVGAQLGNDTTTNQLYPMQAMEDIASIASNTGEIAFSRGNTHVMALTSSGTLLTWGADIREFQRTSRSYGRLINNLTAPVEIMRNVTQISTGGSNALAITSDGALWSWGERPTTIKEDVIFVSRGRNHTMAITSDGALWGWGSNSNGQVGSGENEGWNTFIPDHTRIMTDVIYVSAGSSHTMAITSDGILWGWGNNSSGQLGDETTAARFDPTKIIEDVVKVSSGSSHTMAITSDGTLWGWGGNSLGQLGDGTRVNHSSLIRIMDNVAIVSAGAFHTMAVTTDGMLWTWGGNGYGQLGDGTTEDSNIPIRIMDGIMLP